MGYHWSYEVDADRHQWLLKRNCALRPWQLVSWFATLAVVMLAIALVWAAGGAWIVIPFALVEAIALTAAFVVHARHTGDYERIVATRDRLVVECARGLRVDRFECAGRRIRVEYDPRAREPIRLVAGGEAVAVGRFVPEDGKAVLVRQLRGALGARQ